MSDDSRSPLKDKPLRTPGQSCEERRQQVFEDKLEMPMLAAAAAIGMALLETWRAYLDQPPHPWIYAFFASCAILFFLVRLRKYLPEIRNLRLAAEGEKAVGQFLERLRGKGYEVFHDLPAKGFNVDHVLVGPGGVFTVETKTWRKRGDFRISFDGEKLLVNGVAPDRDPIMQARAQSTWLARQIEDGVGFRTSVRPIVLFPGWWVESASDAFRDVWVLEPKALPSFIERESETLDTPHIRQISYHISRYIRTFAQ